MSTIKYSPFVNNNKKQFTEAPKRTMPWSSDATFSSLGTAWTTKDKSGTYTGAWGHPFPKAVAPHIGYYAKSVKFDDVEPIEVKAWIDDSDMQYIKDDGITTIKGLTYKALGIKVRDEWGKTDKRVSRLFNSEPYSWYGTRNSLSMTVVQLNKATTAVCDGLSMTISWAMFHKVVDYSINNTHDEGAKIELARMAKVTNQEVLRLKVTMLTSEGQQKGHALVRDQDADIEVIAGTYKPEVRFDEDHADKVFLMFSIVHKAELALDVQNISMHGVNGLFDGWLVERAAKYYEEALMAIADGSFGDKMLSRLSEIGDEPTLESARKWFLMDALAHDFDIRWSAHTMGLASNSVVSKAEREFKRMAMPVGGYYRWYVVTDYRYGITVPRGEYVLDGASIVVNAVDYLTGDKSFKNIHDLNEYVAKGGKLEELEPGLSGKLGGCDQDDMLVVLDQFVSRSPTFPGEYWWFAGAAGELNLDVNKLPAPDTYNDTEYGSLQGMKMEGRNKANAMKASTMIMANAGAVGMTAKSLRYWMVTVGCLPAWLPATMEQTIDTAVQAFGDCSSVTEFYRELNIKLADISIHTNQCLPKEIATEFAQITGNRVEFEVDDTGNNWFDQIMGAYRAALINFDSQVEILKGRAMPPVEFITYFDSAIAAAKKLRVVYGSMFMDGTEKQDLNHHETIDEAILRMSEKEESEEFFTNVREECERFLDMFSPEDQVDVMGATMALIYKSRTDTSIPRDFICFQKGRIAQLTLAAFKKAGLTGDPVIVDGCIKLVKNQETPDAPRWHLPIFGAWAYLAGRNPTTVSAKEKKELMERDMVAQVVGRVYRVVPVQTQVRGSMETRYALADVETNKIIGTLPLSYMEVPNMPEAFGVVSAFVFDGALHIVAEDGVLS